MREPKKIAAIKNIRERRVLRIQKAIFAAQRISNFDQHGREIKGLVWLAEQKRKEQICSYHESMANEGAGAIRNAADRLIQWLR